MQLVTLRSLSSFPARAKSKVVLPDPGGPNNNVILRYKQHIMLIWIPIMCPHQTWKSRIFLTYIFIYMNAPKLIWNLIKLSEESI